MRLALVASIITLAGCAGFGNGSAHEPERVGSAGVTVDLPSDWHSLTSLRGTHLIDPLERVVVSSRPLAQGGSGCQVADFAPRPDAVALVVLEWRRLDGRPPPPRPDRFDAQTLRMNPPPAIECFDGSGGTVFFQEHGRVFGAYVLLGKRAPAELVDRARAVLDTLRVKPAA